MKNFYLKPKLFSVLKNYKKDQFVKDITAGIIVAIIAYFIANEGIGLVVRNLVAPVYSILAVLGLDLMSMLNLNNLLGSIEIPINLLGEKLGLKLPPIDWMELAEYGASDIREVATSRSQKANSFINAQRLSGQSDVDNYIKNYPVGYEGRTNKTTQTFIVADKGDVLTIVFTWLFELFENEANQNALVEWIAATFNLQSGAKETVRYAINQLFLKAQIYNAPDIIVGGLFSALGMVLVFNEVLNGRITEVVNIFKDLFGAAGSGGCAYSSIAKIMQDLTGVWDDTIGSDQDH